MTNPTGSALGHQPPDLLDQLRESLAEIRKAAAAPGIEQVDRSCILVHVLMAERLVEGIAGLVGKES